MSKTARKTAPQFVLWGRKLSPVPVKIDGGNRRQCGAELKRRQRDGWTDLVILPPGQSPHAPAVTVAEGAD